MNPGYHAHVPYVLLEFAAKAVIDVIDTGLVCRCDMPGCRKKAVSRLANIMVRELQLDPAVLAKHELPTAEPTSRESLSDPQTHFTVPR